MAVDPRRTAAGCGCPSGGSEAAGTGTIPRACNAGKEATGNCTGMAPLGKYGEYVVGATEVGVAENVATVGVGAEVGVTAVLPYAWV